MTIQQFIEKAIEGGWRPKPEHESNSMIFGPQLTNALFLDPEAWKAVGKVEGWPKLANQLEENEVEFQDGVMLASTFYMHRMIDALAEGKSVEEYLATLTP